MRKISMMVGAAVALFAIVAVAEAANVYTVTIAKVVPTKAGTKLLPKPTTIKFGYSVANSDPSQRPSVTTDYDINFGKQIRQNRALFTARNGASFCTVAQAGYESGQPPACPSKSNVGGGIVKNKFGLAGNTGVLGNCDLLLTVFVGDGKAPSSSFDNDGKVVKSDIVLALKGGENGAPGHPELKCPIAVDAALPAQFVRKPDGSVSLAFHVPKKPFQQPQEGAENAVVDVSSTVGKTVTVKTRKRIKRNGKFVFITVKRLRGLFESVGCVAGGHLVKVTYTDTSGAVNTANKSAPCLK